jgi:hypothetical protein
MSLERVLQGEDPRDCERIDSAEKYRDTFQQ